MRRSLTAVVVALAVAATAACGSSAKPTPQAGRNGGATASASAKPGASASPGATSSAGTPASPGATAPGQQGGKPSAGGVAPSGPASASPTPRAYTTDGTVHPSHRATAQEIPIDAGVTPSCVMPGTTARLDVTTVPKAQIAYLAVYNGEKSGAAPPWGEGYGGNDKGEANDKGKWTTSWTVALTTPSGPARVLLVVGAKGKQRTVEVPFTVGGREAGCGGT